MRRGALIFFLAIAGGLNSATLGGAPAYTLEEAVAVAKKQNTDIAIARKQMEAARGGSIEARAGRLPSVVSTGLIRKRERQEASRLREDDYNASLRIVQNVYSGGAVRRRVALARLNEARQAYELEAVINRVAMDVRIAFHELLLNRAKIRVREQSVGVLQEELKTQQERLAAGTVGELNVRRAEVALANERPELIDAETRLQESHLRLHGLLGFDARPDATLGRIDLTGRLQYQPQHPDLSECLAYAGLNRPELKAREKEIEIEHEQLAIDRSELRPRVDLFSGYEVYNERDPEIGRELNHGYVFGLNASWHLFDGFATRGRVQATQARKDAAIHALAAARLAVDSEVRSAFLDIQQADRVLVAETTNVQNADESLEMAKGNLGAGFGTQLDVLQAASDVTRTRTTRLSAIFLHNVALARLARACAREPAAMGFAAKALQRKDEKEERRIFDVATPPGSLSGQR